jgi:hypothetical protein
MVVLPRHEIWHPINIQNAVNQGKAFSVTMAEGIALAGIAC